MTLRVVLRVDDRTLRYPLNAGDHVLGSAADSDLQVYHFTVSRHHACLHVHADTVEIEDLGSTNGTFVDGRTVDRRLAVTPGQGFTVGAVEGLLEKVSEADLEPAVTVGDTAPTPTHTDDTGSDDTPLTGSLGAVKQFTLEHLPALLQSLAAGAAPAAMAQAVGSAIFTAVPCCAVEVVGDSAHGHAVIYTADRQTSPRRPPFEGHRYPDQRHRLAVLCHLPARRRSG
jgi:hypothetical protein